VLVVLLLLILWPLAEIYFAYLVAEAIGVAEMLVLVGAFSIGGLFVLRAQSRTAWDRFNLALGERRLPSREVGDGLLGFAGGTLLVIPGLISGLIGLLLILPPTKAAARWLVALLVAKRFGLAGSAATWTYATYTTRRGHADYDLTASAEEMPDKTPNTGPDPEIEPPRPRPNEPNRPS